MSPASTGPGAAGILPYFPACAVTHEPIVRLSSQPKNEAAPACRFMSDFDEIVVAHTDAVWRTVYRLLDNRDDVLECFQETFLAALVVHRRQPVRRWRGLLLRIATARSMDRLCAVSSRRGAGR